MARIYWLMLVCCLLSGCSQRNPLQQALASDHPYIRRVMENAVQHDVRVIFTEISRGSDGSIRFTDYSHGVDDSDYFYPASTVKLPVALLALEKLEALEEVDRYSRYTVGDSRLGSSLTNDLRQILVVSDDAAYNRLFEFLGKDDINRRLEEKGIKARISHRLSIPESDLLPTRIVRFSRDVSAPLQIGPIENSPIEVLPLQDLFKGNAHMGNGQLIREPFDFSTKNYLPLSSLHSIMKRLVFPQAFTESERFNLTEEHRNLVLEAMRTVPRDAGYDEASYPDARLKYLMVGDSSDRLPGDIAITNKVGLAYGTLTDTAYIVDHEKQREFLISATVHVNANGVFNDNVYEYDEIGKPFLAELGRQLVLD